MAYQTVLAAVGGLAGLLTIVSWLNSRRKRTNIRGKVVLITGANSGLGKECASVFYKAGCNIILAGRNLQQLQQVKQDLEESGQSVTNNRAEVLQIDLSDLSSIDRKVAEAVAIFGHVDILVNNAGISYRGCILDTDMAVHQKLMTVNYFGQVALTKGLLPYMTEANQGHIVAISSVQGRIAIPNRSAYAASKHAFQAFFDSLRAELADTGVHVCVVSPGYISTNLSRNALNADGSAYGILDKSTETGMDPTDVAHLIVSAVERNTSELLPASFTQKAAIVIRTLAPQVYFWIMKKRALKERRLNQKKQ